MDTHVDVVVLTRDRIPIDPTILDSVLTQEGVTVHLHRVIGTPRPADSNRWETIARARNVGRTLGDSPWVMFVDDDVVLGANCIAQLTKELSSKPEFAVIAADYRDERDRLGTTSHVAMGATLFRRDTLDGVAFRWEVDRCECQCMADDLRSRFLGIDYSAVATASHIKRADSDTNGDTRQTIGAPAVTETRTTSSYSARVTAPSGNEPVENETIGVSPESNSNEHRDGEILVAFDRRHMGLFRGQFLSGLRRSGNENTVHAIAYGLREKHARALRRIGNVEVHPQPYTVRRVCRNRMFGFQVALKELCPKTPVAYWDAGDVLFQSSLEPLWDQVRQNPDTMLVVEEPLSFESNLGQQAWARSISDPIARSDAWSALVGKPVVNGGFVAATAGVLLTYFEKAHRLINGDLLGAGGGDQIVLNVYKNTHPEEFQVIDDTWNYCLVGRSGRHCKVRRGEYLDVLNGRVISVVHGNAKTLL